MSLAFLIIEINLENYLLPVITCFYFDQFGMFRFYISYKFFRLIRLTFVEGIDVFLRVKNFVGGN